jgi:hypothetical protein
MQLCTGVTLFATFEEAPARSSATTASVQPRLAAMWSAVLPSCRTRAGCDEATQPLRADVRSCPHWCINWRSDATFCLP